MKKNRIIQLIFITVAFVAMISSCKKTESKPTKIEYDSIVVDKKIPLLAENDTTLPSSQVKISFTYPVKFRNEEDLARLQQIYQGTFFGDRVYDSMSPQQAVDNYISNYAKEYKELSNDYYADMERIEDAPIWYNHYLSAKNRELFRSDSLVSYAVEKETYTGGAHGGYSIVYTNIDLNDLVTLSEEDLFVADYYRPLTDKIKGQLMKQYNVSEPDSLMRHGFFEPDDIIPNNNFWLDDAAIHYTYNQYEIAPYAMGVIDVAIPYSELKDILKPNGFISRHFLKEEK